MTRCLIAVAAVLAALPPLAVVAKPNVLLLCIDDLRPELNAFGVEHIRSPNIDHLAATGRAFHRHYVNSPTCGASRYTLLTGRYGPAGNHALFQRAELIAEGADPVPPSMPEWFRTHGYTTVAVGKVSHHPGGLGGEDWDDPSVVEMPRAWDRSLMPSGAWQTSRGAMHGLANGEQREPGVSKGIQSVEGPDTTYPDGLIADEGIHQLQELATQDEPFFLAIGLIKPHLPFGSPQQYMAPYQGRNLPATPHPDKPQRRTTWHRSGEFFGPYVHDGKDPREDAAYAEVVRRHYAACVTYADKQVGRVIDALKATGRADNTIIVLWGDHGWHLGEHGIWGKHCLFEEALRSPLIISAPGATSPGEQTDAVVETVDIFPTLCELAGLPGPEFGDGVSLTTQLADPAAEGHTAFSYQGDAQTLRTKNHRLILHRDGFVELYDHNSSAGETVNVADQHPVLCDELLSVISAKAAERRNAGG